MYVHLSQIMAERKKPATTYKWSNRWESAYVNAIMERKERLFAKQGKGVNGIMEKERKKLWEDVMSSVQALDATFPRDMAMEIFQKKWQNIKNKGIYNSILLH